MRLYGGLNDENDKNICKEKVAGLIHEIHTSPSLNPGHCPPTLWTPTGSYYSVVQTAITIQCNNARRLTCLPDLK